MTSHAFQTQLAVLTICNPAHRVTTVTLRQLTAEEEVEKLAHLLQSPESSFAGRLVKGKDSLGEIRKNLSVLSPTIGFSGDLAESNTSVPWFSTVKVSHLRLESFPYVISLRSQLKNSPGVFTKHFVSLEGKPECGSLAFLVDLFSTKFIIVYAC